MLIHHFLEHSAQTCPDKNAVWYQKQWMTYQQLDQRSNQVANFLCEKGIHRGDRVALLLENSFDYIIAYFAVLKTGAIVVPLNTMISEESLTFQLNDSGARALILQSKYRRKLSKIIEHVPTLKISVFDKSNPLTPNVRISIPEFNLAEIYQTPFITAPEVRCIDLDLAEIVYTSGSTGRPKGVMLSHLNIVTNTRSIVEYFRLSSQDRIMVILPFTYIFGQSLLNTHFFVSGSLVIENRVIYPNVVLNAMQETEATGFAGVPSTYLLLLHKSNLKKMKFPNLRYVAQAGGAMAATVQKEVARIFSPAELFVMYGATEAGARLAYLPPTDLPRKWGSIGQAIPNVELFIADENGNKLAAGEVGEIVARGSNIMAGYWNAPDETQKALRNGLYFTGDLGKADDEGFLYVVGRKSQFIKVGGKKVSCQEVEEKLLEIEGICETAVIGIEDELLGEAIKAFVVYQNGINPDIRNIKAQLSKKVPTYKVPQYIEFIPELPKNSSGKIMKEKLKTL